MAMASRHWEATKRSSRSDGLSGRSKVAERDEVGDRKDTLEQDVEFQFPEIIDHNTDQCQKVFKDERATNLHLNLRAIDAVIARDTERNVDGTEEFRGELVDTITSNGPSCLSGTDKEKSKTDSTAEHGQNTVTNTEIHTNGVCPVEFTSLQAMRVGETEEDVVAPTHVFEKLFQDYVNKLTITPKANDLEGEYSHSSACRNVEQLDVLLVDNDRVDDVEHSTENQSERIKNDFVEIRRESVTVISDDDDECVSIASSSNAASYEEADCEDMEMEEAEESEEAILDMADVRFQSSSQTISEETQEQRSQVMSMNNPTAPVDQLSGRSGQVKSNNLPFQLLDSETQEVLNGTVESGSSAATNSFSPLTNLLKSNLKVPSSLKQHMIIHSGEKFMSYEREKEVSSPVGSQASAIMQTLPSSNQPQKAREVPSSLSSHDISNFGRSSFLRHVEALAFSNNLPDGATLVDKRGIFCTQDKLKPFVCAYCGNAYGRMDLVSRHIEQQHNAIPRFACEFCSQRFGHQYYLSQHLKTHSQKVPLKHRELNLLSCDVCNKSFQTKVDFVAHCKAHKEEKLREILTCKCSICKKVFRSPSTLKQHMISHSGEAPFESSLLKEQIQPKPGLLNHTISSNDGHVSGITNSDKFRNEDASDCEVAIVGESRIQNTTETISIESHGPTEGDSSKTVIGKRVSVEAGVVYEDEVSSHGSQSLEALAFSNNLPDGATLVDKRGIFRTQDKLKPFVCGYCGNAYGRMDLVSRHIEQQHNAILRFACEFCSQRFGHQFHLSQHLVSHSQIAPLKDRELNLLSCDVCNESFQTQVDFVAHCKAHEEEKLREILTCTCSICKKVFRSPSTLKQHMMIHSGETPLESSLLEEQIQPNTGLLNHPISSNDEHVSGITNSDRFCNEDLPDCEMAIVGESRIQNTTETISIESDRPAEGDSSEAVIGKQVSVETGVVYEDEVSSHGSQSPIVTQTLLSADHSVAEKSLPSSYSRQSHHDLGASSTFRKHFESTQGPKLPPGSKLLSYRGVFRIKDEEKPFACGYCGKSYKANSAVNLHIRWHHDEKLHSCEFCGKRFAESSFLAVHIRIHTQKNPFTCDQCGKQFRFDSDLRKHKYAHSEERLFHCDQCSKSYKTNNGLSIHKESHKTEEQRKGVACDICKKKFGMPSLLKNHMRIHTGEKPFKCTLCDKQFRLKVQLRNHMDNHSGMNRNANKPCSICGKTFSANHMPDHMRMHAVVKTFECNVCGKWFLKKENLDGHMGSHTGEKPFACDRCDKRYALYSYMVNHKAKCSVISGDVV